MLVSVLIIGSLVQPAAVPVQDIPSDMAARQLRTASTHTIFITWKRQRILSGKVWVTCRNVPTCSCFWCESSGKAWQYLQRAWEHLACWKNESPRFLVLIPWEQVLPEVMLCSTRCLLSCLLSDIVPGPRIFCKMVGRERRISGRRDLGHHTVKPVWLPLLSKGRRDRWWNYQVYKIIDW